MLRPSTLLVMLCLVNAALFIGSLMVGPVPVDLATWWHGQLPLWQAEVIEVLRLPRAMAAFCVGALLALAGLLMQVLLRNPLAEPYVLGISGGAAVAALGTMVVGALGIWVSINAFFGALLSMLVVFLLAGQWREWSGIKVLLTGVVMASGWGAVISLLLVLGPDQSLRGMLFWLMGDLAVTQLPLWALGVVVAGLVAGLVMAPALDLLAQGDEQAALLGVEVHRLRAGIFVTASLLTACAVTLAGPVGFVGLVVPHSMRLVIGARHRLLMPASLLAGGALLLAADVLSRTVLAPHQLPVGVLTAGLGVPVFLWLLRRQGRAS